jgi:cyclophilin family peptidyl-prolyl cis-trans isomerase
VAGRAVSPGADYIIPLLSTDSSAVTYTVSTTNPAFFNSAAASNLPNLPIISSSGDDLTIVTPDGTMKFLLLDGDSIVKSTVARIENAVNSGYYQNATFYYSSQTSVTGGTMATGSNPLQIDPVLQFTEPGILSILGAGTANMDSNDFSITTQALSPVVNGLATIFGIQTAGFDVAEAVAGSPAGSDGFLTPAVPITSISVTPDDTSAVLLVPVAQGASGSATISVAASDGSGSPAQMSFSVATAPTVTVTSVSPTSGPVVGGTQVTITGTGFTGATAVDFGGQAATSFTVNSDSSISAVSPAGDPGGAVDVTVTTPRGTSATSAADQFTYDAVPSLVSITTPTGTQSGDVTISYNLADAGSDPCSIAVQYSGDGGATWHAATAGTGGDGTTGLTSSPSGTAHTYVWASGTHLAGANNSNVEICLTPTDVEGTGSAVATGAFTVSNHVGDFYVSPTGNDLAGNGYPLRIYLKSGLCRFPARGYSPPRLISKED